MEKRIPVAKENFYCKGQFKIMHRGKPDATDLKAVREYAKAVCREKKVTK